MCMKKLLLSLLVFLATAVTAQTTWKDASTGLAMVTVGPWKVKPATSKNAIAICYLQNTKSFSENGDITIRTGKSAREMAKKDYAGTRDSALAAKNATKANVLAESPLGSGYQIAYLLTGKHSTFVAATYYPLVKQPGKFGRCMVRAIVTDEAAAAAKWKEYQPLLAGFSAH